MLLRLDQLPAHLKSGSLAPLYVLHGDEALLVQEAQEAIRAAARAAGFITREVFSVETGFDWAQLRYAGDAMSLFADKKLLELAIPSGKPGTTGGDTLQQLAGNPNPDNLLLISLPRLDKTTQGSKWFQALADAGATIAIAAVERAALPAWLSERLARNGQSTDTETLEFLADRVEGNLLAARQEVDKLALLYPAGKLSLPQVREAVLNVARFDAFQLSEAVLAGDAALFIRMLEGVRAEGEAPTLALWSLAEEAHTLYRMQLGLKDGQPFAQLCRELRVWGDRQGRIRDALRRADRGTLLRAVRLASRADRAAKGLGGEDAWHLLERLGLLLCGVDVPEDALPRA